MKKAATILESAVIGGLLIFPLFASAQVAGPANAVEPIPEIAPSAANGNRLQTSVSNAQNLPDRDALERQSKDKEYERGLQQARDKDAAEREAQKPASAPAGPQPVSPSPNTFDKPESPSIPEPPHDKIGLNPAGPNEREYVATHSSPSHPSSDPITEGEKKERAAQVAQEKAAADKVAASKAAATKAAADKAAADRAARAQRDSMREFNDHHEGGHHEAPLNGSPGRGGGYRDVPDHPDSSNKS